MVLTPGKANEAYDKLRVKRRPFECRGEDASAITIPNLYQADNETNTDDESLPDPYQSLGARGVNNLSAKLVLALFPPGVPFFKFAPDIFRIEELSGQDDILTEIEEGLVKMEKAVLAEIESKGLRPVVHEAFKHTIVTGNGLIHLPAKSRARFFDLNQYVIKRDPMGDILKLIVKEEVAVVLLEERFQEAADKAAAEGRQLFKGETAVVYTVIVRESKQRYKVWQEVDGSVVPGTMSSTPAKELPWIPLRFNIKSREDYGRGMVEDYRGDLQALEVMTQAIAEAAVASSRVINLVSPHGATNIEDLQNAPNGAFISGEATDVHTIQVNKGGDLRVTLETMNQGRQRLELAFLMNTAAQRSGDRVTATEIRVVIQELQEALGGTFAVFGEEFQLPIVNVVTAQMRRAGTLPDLPADAIKTTITTGVDALGRGQDLSRLEVALSVAQRFIPPELMASLVNAREILGRIFAAAGVNTDGALKSQEQIQQEQQAAQQQQALQSPAAAAAINQAGQTLRSSPDAAPQQTQ